jgi:microcystin-dependent protein
MSPSFVGSIWLFGGNFQPVNFQYCNGQLISIAQNETLYTLIGTTFGGDGTNTFGLPDLRGRVAVGMGQGPGTSLYVIGQAAASEQVTMGVNQMPSHTHLINASSTPASAAIPANNLYFAAAANSSGAETLYSTAAANATMSNGTIGNGGNSLPFSIVQPVLCSSYIIAMFGIFPTRN